MTGRAAGRAEFEEHEPIEDEVPLDAWGGWVGEGVGPGKSLMVSTGVREGGSSSQIFRLDMGADVFVDDEAPEGAETLNKIRSNAATIYAFFESPEEGQTWIIAKPQEHEGAGGWEFESLPTSGRPVGGRGLGINGLEGERVVVGCSQNWNAGGHQAQTYERGEGGGWELRQEVTPSLLWEIEFDGEGQCWEFFSDFTHGGNTAVLFVDGEEKTYPPGHCISHATWFKDHMYAIGNLVDPEAANKIYRSTDGSEWAEVHTMDAATMGDHVQFIPRGEEGEIWYTGHDPFEAGYSLDGEEWVREESLPEFPTGQDTNHLTAIAYWGPDIDDEKERGVWIFARDADAGTTRIFSDVGAGALILQVI